MGTGEIRSPRLLVVEPDGGRQRELGLWLSQSSLVHEFVSGSSAAILALRAAVRQHSPFDIAIISRAIPLMNGIQLIAAIRDDSTIAATRVILRSDDAADAKILEHSAADRMVGLDDREALLVAIRRWAEQIPRPLQTARNDDSQRGSPETGDAAVESPVFDQQAFGERLDFDAEIMSAVAEVFFDDGVQVLRQLGEAIGQGDWSQCAALGHKIKGSSANVGGMALSAQAGRIEDAVRKKQVEHLAGELAELERRFGALKSAMASLLA